MHVHCAVFAVEGIAPDLVEQLIPGEHHVTVFQQHTQQLKFLEGQGHLLTLYFHQMAFGTHHQTACPVAFRGGPIFDPAQQSFDPGDKLHHAEGLGDVVVGTGLQTDDLVIFTALGGEHDHRRAAGGGTLPQLAQHLQAVLFGQHDIQQDQLGSLPGQHLPEGRGSVKARGLKTGIVQCINYQFPDAGVVFHQKNHKNPPFLRVYISFYHGFG